MKNCEARMTWLQAGQALVGNIVGIEAAGIFHQSAEEQRLAAGAGAEIDDHLTDATPGLYGTLWQSTALALPGSPYAVAGDLTVAPGVTLTIPAGVTLTFATTDVMGAGLDTGRAEFQIAGTLLADATPASPINLTSASPSPGTW